VEDDAWVDDEAWVDESAVDEEGWVSCVEDDACVDDCTSELLDGTVPLPPSVEEEEEDEVSEPPLVDEEDVPLVVRDTSVRPPDVKSKIVTIEKC
jgi:hypothetical protein